MKKEILKEQNRSRKARCDEKQKELNNGKKHH
jgi:hypothetical protein